VLEEFLERPEIHELLGRDFVMVKIDQDEMEGGKQVADILRKGVQGGIPWFVFLDAKGDLIEADGDGNWSRVEGAVLATADGPGGNVGCPMTPPERAHFIATLRASRVRLSDADLDTIASALHGYAREQIGEEADAN